MENTNPTMPPPPPQGNPYQNNPYQHGAGYQQFGGMTGQIDHPKASTINSLGIIAIVCTFVIGIVGLILNIVTLAMSAGVMSDINSNPGRYTEASIRKIRTGRTCAIVGLSIQGALILILIMVALAGGF